MHAQQELNNNKQVLLHMEDTYLGEFFTVSHEHSIDYDMTF